MEPLFEIRSKYNEAMFLSQVQASTPPKTAAKKKESRISGQNLRDVAALVILFGTFYIIFGNSPMDVRVSQALMCAVAAWAIFRYIRKTRKKDLDEESKKKTENQKRQAQTLLMNSGLSGMDFTVRFYEDEFEVENPGSLTSYRYEGIAWIKETAEYIVIFWNQSLAVPVEKSGFSRGKAAQLVDFLSKRCNKTIEKVRSYRDV